MEFTSAVKPLAYDSSRTCQARHIEKLFQLISKKMDARIKKILVDLESCNFKIVTAESCTAGMLASMIAEVPGCGQWLECAFVTYSADAKKRCLGVRAETIREFGLSSEEVAREMALGALPLSEANLAIATTGVAGELSPDGKTTPGTVCFSWAFGFRKLSPAVYTETRIFNGSRNAVRRKACKHAILRIRHFWKMAQGVYRFNDEIRD